MSGMLVPVRSEQIETVAAWLACELPLLAEQYGNRVTLPDHVLSECLDLVLTRFKHIGKEEIREAYRMWATGSLGELPAGEMYGGIYQARHLGAILKAYSDVRKKVMYELVCESDRLKREQDEVSTKQMKQAELERWFVEGLEEHRAKIKGWEEIPEFWYDMSRRLNLFTIETEEAYKILDEARGIVYDDFSAELANGTTRDRRMYLLNVLNPDSEGGQGAILAKAKQVARKMTVYRKLFSPTQTPTHEPTA